MASELAPGFLLASPSLADPNFQQTVILLIDHRPEGSLGFIVNRPAKLSFRGVVEELGLKTETGAYPKLPVMVGGPVAPHTGWIVFDPRISPMDGSDTIRVSEQLRVSASRDHLKELANKHDTDRHLLVLGYAGWGAGQLDAELRQGTWIPADLDESIIFETPVTQRWDLALEGLGINPLHVVRSNIAEA